MALVSEGKASDTVRMGHDLWLVVDVEYGADPFQADRVTIIRSCFGSCSRSGRFAIVPSDVLDNGDVCEPGEVPVLTYHERRLAGVRSVS
jgi:hypothetical protein